MAAFMNINISAQMSQGGGVGLTGILGFESGIF